MCRSAGWRGAAVVIQMMDLRQRPRSVRIPVHTDSVHAAVMSQLIVLEESRESAQRAQKDKTKLLEKEKFWRGVKVCCVFARNYQKHGQVALPEASKASYSQPSASD